jgi:hypothetical protein
MGLSLTVWHGMSLTGWFGVGWPGMSIRAGLVRSGKSLTARRGKVCPERWGLVRH